MSQMTDILDRPSNTVERAPPMPTGTYLCVVQGMPRYDESTAKKTKFIEWSLSPRQVADDVDREELSGAGGLEGKKFRRTIYYMRGNGEEINNADFQIREFISHCGVDTEVPAKLRALAEQTMNQSVMVKIKHVPSQDGKYMIAEIASTGPVED